MNSRSRWLGITAIVAVVACVGACAAVGLGIRFAPDLYLFFQKQNSLSVGSAAPDFSLATLEGRTVKLSQFEGHPVMLTFAASWCPDCRSEAPMLQSLHTQYPELSILLVDSSEQDEVVRNFASEFRMTHPVLLDTFGAVSNQYHIYAIPTTFFIDSKGVIRGLIIEGVTSQVVAEKLPLIGIEP